jgi:hypothetical protein
MLGRALLFPALLASVAASACGGKGAGGSPIGSRAGGTPSAPAITLAEDVAELARAAREGEQQSAWPERVTFLGWTAEHHAAYRVLVCNPDELGGRGPYCELRVCHASAATEATGGECEDAAQFELYGEIDFDAAAVTAAAEQAIRALGPLGPGTPRPLDAARLSIEGQGLSITVLDRPHVLMAPPEEDGESGGGLGVVEAAVTYVVDTADGTCRAVLGDGKVMGEYEGVRGRIPYLFAAVGCK